MTVDTVTVRAIGIEASIGTLAWEKQIKQRLEVDVALCHDTERLLATGDLRYGVDFEQVVRVVRAVAERGHVELLEALADQIAAALLESTLAHAVTVEVRKHSAQYHNVGHFGVIVNRCRQDERPAT